MSFKKLSASASKTVVANDPDDGKGKLKVPRRFAIRSLEQYSCQSGDAGAVDEELKLGGA